MYPAYYTLPKRIEKKRREKMWIEKGKDDNMGYDFEDLDNI